MEDVPDLTKEHIRDLREAKTLFGVKIGNVKLPAPEQANTHHVKRLALGDKKFVNIKDLDMYVFGPDMRVNFNLRVVWVSKLGEWKEQGNHVVVGDDHGIITMLCF